MEESNFLLKTVQSFLSNNMDFLSIDKELRYKKFKTNIFQEKSKSFIQDNEFSIEIIFDEVMIEEFLDSKPESFRLSSINFIKVNGFELKFIEKEIKMVINDFTDNTTNSKPFSKTMNKNINYENEILKQIERINFINLQESLVFEKLNIAEIYHSAPKIINEYYDKLKEEDNRLQEEIDFLVQFADIPPEIQEVPPKETKQKVNEKKIDRENQRKTRSRSRNEIKEQENKKKMEEKKILKEEKKLNREKLKNSGKEKQERKKTESSKDKLNVKQKVKNKIS